MDKYLLLKISNKDKLSFVLDNPKKCSAHICNSICTTKILQQARFLKCIWPFRRQLMFTFKGLVINSVATSYVLLRSGMRDHLHHCVGMYNFFFLWTSYNDEITEFRSSRPEVLCKKVVLRNFTKFTGLKKRSWHKCFPVNFVKFLRTHFLTEQLLWLLLCIALK